jgi:hypothetical protein
MAAAVLAATAACTDTAPSRVLQPAAAPLADRAGNRTDRDETREIHGKREKLGDGSARTYVILGGERKQVPIEIGVVLDKRALEGLPTSAPGGPEPHYEHLLELPKHHGTQFQFVELDWNQAGHEPPGVYTVPHFDFHFYTISLAERNSIDPSDPQFAAKANNVPTGPYVPPFYIVPGPPAAVAVPHMGVHWLDVRSPELQGLLGNPSAYRPFTKTFIYGSWNGRLTFFEPMITLEYLRSRPNVVTPIPQPARYPQPGYYPTGYRVTYDAHAREHRIGLVGLTWRD